MELHSNKMTKAGTGKPMEQERARKQQQCKSRPTANHKVSSIKSKAGFTLYSEPAKPARSKIQKTLINSKNAQDGKELEEQFLQSTEVLSQMQTDLLKEKEARGIVIPVADFESDGDSTEYGDIEYQEFGTPFNKRLVSSTPDPERLLEVELLEQQKNQPSMLCPQMIPERDTTLPVRPSAVTSSLSEKLKLQRQHFQQQSNKKQKHAKHQQPMPSAPNQTWKHHKVQLCVSNLELPSAASLPVTVAEWVPGDVEHQDGKMAGLAPALVSSSKGLQENSTTRPLNPAIRRQFCVAEAAGSDTKGGNTITQTKIAAVKEQPDAPPSAQDNRLHVTNSSEKNIWSSKHAANSHMLGDHHSKCSFPIQHTLTNETVSNKASDYLNPNGKSDAYVKAAVGFEKTRSGSSQPELSSLTIGPVDSSSNFMHSTRRTFTESNTRTAEPKPHQTDLVLGEESTKSCVNHQLPKQNISSSAKANTKTNLEKINEDSGIGNTDSSLKLHAHHSEVGRMDDIRLSSTKDTMSPVDIYPRPDDLDTTGDTCDMEVTVLYDQNTNARTENKETKLNETMESAHEEDTDRKSSASDSGNLSQVIEFLKRDAFNKSENCEVAGKLLINEVRMVIDDIDIAASTADLQRVQKQPGDDQTLAELMQQYLPETDRNNANNNNTKYGFSDVDKEREDEDSSGAKADVEVNMNQNHFSDETSHYEMEPPRPTQKHLRYLERMADPTLRDIACRLVLKATAIRDVELRDLIDDMIFHTDVALGRSDAQLHSNQIFYVEENNKLKKRVQNINQQLDAKERQEREGTKHSGYQDNDVLHLERKIMYLTQEKEKLDGQVTTLLGEKAKWLITQQDLVCTISLKDHELLKLEEKHNDEKKILHQSLDHATKNSQGVHYKLFVADREISNLEQSIRARSMEIMELNERLAQAEGKLLECERRSVSKDQEMLRLQDLVDALKIGVDHVLQAYESSSSKDGTTANQRQGINNLRQMVHPQDYRTLPAPRELPQAEHKTGPVRGPHQTFSSSQRTSTLKESHTNKKCGRHEQHYSISAGPQPHERHQFVEDSHPRTAQPHERHQSVEDSHPRAVQPHERHQSVEDSHPRTAQPHERHQSVEDSHPRAAQPHERHQSVEDSHPRAAQPHERHQSVEDSHPRTVESHERHQSLEDSHPRTAQQSQHRPRSGDRQGRPPRHLTSKTLEEHNRCLSPVDRTLWRSLDNEPRLLRILGEDPYYSDSEIEINGPRQRRLSNRYHQSAAGTVQQRSNVPHVGMSQRPTLDRPQQLSSAHGSNGWNEFLNSQTTHLSTLRSETIPKSLGSHEASTKSPPSEETYYSTLRSAPLSEDSVSTQGDQHPNVHFTSEAAFQKGHLSPGNRYRTDPRMDSSHEGDPLEITPTHETYLPGSLPVSHSAHSASPHPEQLFADSYGIPGHHSRTFPHTSIETEHEFRQPHHREHPFHSTAHPSQDQHRGLSRSADNAMSYRHHEPHLIDLPYQRSYRHHEPHLIDPPDHLSYRHHEPHLIDPPDHLSYRHHEPHLIDPPDQRSYRHHEPHVIDLPDHLSYRHHEPHLIDLPDHLSYSRQSHLLNDRSSFPTSSSPTHITDISISRRATRDTEDVTQREFFQGTELSVSLSSISEADAPAVNNNQLRSLNEDPFSTGIASLDEKIANLQRKIDRTKAMFS